MTDIIATAVFISSDQKGCSLDSKENCATQKYVKKVTEECGCLPFSIKTEEYAKVRDY